MKFRSYSSGLRTRDLLLHFVAYINSYIDSSFLRNRLNEDQNVVRKLGVSR